MEKEVLEVNQNVSKSIRKVKTAFLVLSAIGVIIVIGNLIAGNVNSNNEDIYWSLLCCSVLVPLINIPLINGFATIVKATEYHNAQVESKYEIKSK